jgi:quercetin dioxygenase-like cupin family protein
VQVTRFPDAAPYDAPNHFGVASFRLQGQGATDTKAFWCGISHVLPGGGAKNGAAPLERVYVVIEGEITVGTAAGETVLRPLDSCCIGADEERWIENRGGTLAKLLVVMQNPEAPR